MPLESLGTKGYTEDQLVQHCLEANQAVWDSTRVIRSQWDDHWALYNGQFDFSEKQKWQSRQHIPKSKMAVRVTKSVLKQALLKADNFFAFRGLNEDSREVEKDIEKGLLRIFEQAMFKQKIFTQGLFLGLLENLIVFKVFPQEMRPSDRPIHESQEFKLVIKPIRARDFRIDTTGRNRFVIHRTKMDLADFKKLVSRGVYRKDALDAVIQDFVDYEQEYREKIQEGLVDIEKPSWRKEVELLEYWGDVDDAKGNRIYENVTFTVVNRKALARYPIQNPFRHGRPPFVWGPIIEKAGSVYAEGFLDAASRIDRMLTETMNLVLDSNTASSVKAYEVNLDWIHNPSELKSGIYPGKVIKTRGVPPGGQAIREFMLGQVSPQSFQVLTFLDRSFQEATGVNEFIAGTMGAGDKTATETKIKTSQSQSLMHAVAQDIEDNVLEDLIEMGYSVMLQYNPEVYGERVLRVPANVLKFEYSARAMSKILSQIDDLQQIFMWIGMVSKTPIAQKINWDKIGEMSVRLINQDPRDLLLMEEAKPRDVGVPNNLPQLLQMGGQNG